MAGQPDHGDPAIWSCLPQTMVRTLVASRPGFALADQTAHHATFEFQLVGRCQLDEARVSLAVFRIIDLALDRKSVV